MNPFEQQMQLGRDLMELNAQWLRKIAEFDTENFNKYVQLNQDFAAKLPEIKDVQGYWDLQRDYGEKLWNDTQEVMKTRGEMLQQAASEGGEVVRKAFTTETEKPKKASAAKAA